MSRKPCSWPRFNSSNLVLGTTVLHDKYSDGIHRPNRLASTHNSLRKHEETHILHELYRIKERLLSLNTADIRNALRIASSITA